jgi:hypothetical protein
MALKPHSSTTRAQLAVALMRFDAQKKPAN